MEAQAKGTTTSILSFTGVRLKRQEAAERGVEFQVGSSVGDFFETREFESATGAGGMADLRRAFDGRDDGMRLVERRFATSSSSACSPADEGAVGLARSAERRRRGSWALIAERSFGGGRPRSASTSARNATNWRASSPRVRPSRAQLRGGRRLPLRPNLGLPAQLFRRVGGGAKYDRAEQGTRCRVGCFVCRTRAGVGSARFFVGARFSESATTVATTTARRERISKWRASSHTTTTSRNRSETQN